MKKYLLLLCLSICCSMFSKLYATHVMGADLTFQCIGPNKYLVTLTGYRDCQGIQLTGPLVINVSSAQCGVNTTLTLNQVGPPVDITPVCLSIGSSCSGGSGIGIEKDIFQGVLNLPAGCGSDWILSWTLCCRNNAITTLSNPGGENLYIEAHLNNTLATCDDSPTFTNNPVGVWCDNYPQFFNHGATDANGDSLYFYLMPSLNGPGSQVAYASPYSGTNPIGTAGGGTVINHQNGQLTFTPNQTQVAVMKVGVDEYRNGVLIGHIERDMELIIENCTNHPPTSGGVNGVSTGNPNAFTFNTTACSNFCFTIQTADLDAGDSVYYNFLNSSMPGATITSSGGQTPLLTICWAPTQNDVGSHTFVLSLRDNHCPYFGTSSQAYTVVVAGASDPPVNAGPDVSLCPGQSTTLTATSTGTVTSYTWSDGTTTHSGATWTVSPAITTIYTVTAVYANGCQLTDQVVVTRDVAPTVTAFPINSTICSTSDTIQLSAFATNATSYQWTPAAGLTCTTCANPKASPTASTTYTVVAVDAAGCPGPPFNVTVNLSPPPPVQSCAVIYATVNGSGNGTQASPASLATALSMSQCNNALIKLGIGTYIIDNPITNISSYTTIEGGFDPANNWIKSSTPGATTIHRSALNMEGTVFDKRIVAIYMNGNNYFRFQDLTIETADCPALAAADNSGYSNYVLHMTNSAHYDIVRCQIKPGAPTNGRAGTSPPGTGGAATGGTGGAGGAGAGTGCNQNGSGGTAGGAASSGAAGGSAGAGANGSGCNTVGCGVNASSGTNGGAGAAGVAGTSASGVAPATPPVTTTFFMAGGQAGSGTNGTAGGGGGGGGGGQMGTDCTCSIGGNNNGTAGTAGGNGGLAGTGGYGGGGSFGIYLNGNGAGSNITDCDIIGNVAGVGGVGGTGQAGTNSVAATAASTTTGSCSPQSSGGTGGKGGNGGAGGNGQPGASGVAAEIVLNGTAPTYTAHGTATAIVTGINNPPLFNLGAQSVISCANISCTNRNDTLSSAASGNWTTGAGATVPTGTGASLITQYSTTGRKDIGYNANTYTGFVYIAINQSSFIPDIQSSAPVLNPDTFWVCKGSSANFNIQIASADTFQWDFGGATVPNTYYGSNVQNLNGLTFNTAGTFLIQARIKTSCCGWSPWDTAYLLVEPNSTINYTGLTTFCPGDSVHIVLGGIGSSYSWAPTAGVSNPTGSNVYLYPQVTTTYLATSYSPRGLCNADTSIPITKLTPPTVAFTTTAATCGSIGSATATPSPAGTYSYVWSPGGATTATISPEPAGTYTVTVTPQGTTCSVTASTSISAAGGLQAYITKSISPQCFGQCTGQIKVEAIGGTGPFTYHWSTGPNGPVDSLNNLCAGTYNVTITGAGGCTASATQQLAQPQLLTVVILDSVSPVCPGQCTGYALADGSGGTGPYSFLWSNGETSQKDTLLCPGHYTVGIVDNHLCTASGAVNITSPLPMSIAFASVNDSCFGLCDGHIKATVTNGQGPITYHWSSTPTNVDSLKNLCAGNYTLTVTDSLLCTVTAADTITQPVLLSIALVSSINDSCNGQCNGSITVLATGGTTPYTYTWSNAATGATAGNLCFGPYSVTVKDALGCTATLSHNITQPLALGVVITSTINDTCNGQCNGSTAASASGGTTPYTYTWSNAATGPSINNLCAGPYTVTVKDALGCTASVSTSVSQPPPLVLTLVSTTNPSCFGSCDGQIVISGSGGSPGYLYSIDFNTPTPFGTFTGLCAGMHIVGVGDTHICIDTLHITLGQPSQILGDTVSTKPVTCFGGNDGAITLSVSGGSYPYTYAWPQSPANNDSLGVNLTAGTYTPIITDANGCKDTVTATVTQPSLLTATVVVDSISCFGGSDGKVFITALGGVQPYSYQLDGAGPYQAPDSFTGLGLGPHSIIVQDANLCTTTVPFNVYQPDVLTASIIGERDASCFNLCNGMAQVGALGGTQPYSYSIDGLTYYLVDSFSSLCAGSYTITVLDIRGCSTTVPVTVNQPTALGLVQTGATPPHCFDGNDATFTVSGSGGTPGYSYSADGGVTYQANPLFTGQTPGSLLVTMQDANGCTDTLTVIIPNAPPNDTYTTAVTNVTCNGGSDGSITAALTQGLTVPYTYAWYQNGTPYGGNTPGLTNIPAGIYTVVITDGNGCRLYSTVDTVVTQPLPISDTYVPTMPKCFGGSDGSVVVTPSGGTGPYTHSWNNGNTTNNPTGLAAGTYTDTIRDANLCIYIDNNIIVGQPTPVTDALATTPVLCPGDSDATITVTPGGGTPGYSYNWSPNTASSAVATGLKIGEYYVTVTDANGCTVSDSANIIALNPMVLNAVKKNVLCPPLKNGFIILPVTGGTPAYNFIWNTGSTSDYLPGLSEGVYNVTITDANGCELDTSFVVGNDSSFAIRVTPDSSTINQGDQVLMATDVIGGTLASITWSPETWLTCTDCTTPVATPMHPVEYMIHGVSDSGCVSDVRAYINVISQHQLYVPNTFTPNGDGINDTWEIFGNKKAWKFVEVEVFDRWGEKVFQSNDVDFAWDGTFRGTRMEPNVYVYVLTVTFVDAYTTKNKGTVTIIR